MPKTPRPSDGPGSAATISTEALLDAALDAFADRGFDGTSVREIARSLGVSHNLIPKRIGSKDDLWFAAVDRGFGRLAVDLAAVVNDTDVSDELTRLRALVVQFIVVNATRPALLRIINQEAALPGPRLDHIFATYIDPVRAFGDALLAGLRQRGEVRTDSTSLLYFMMTHGAGGPLALPSLAERFGASVDPDDPVAVRRHATEAADLLFRGLVGPADDEG